MKIETQYALISDYVYSRNLEAQQTSSTTNTI